MFLFEKGKKGEYLEVPDLGITIGKEWIEEVRVLLLLLLLFCF